MGVGGSGTLRPCTSLFPYCVTKESRTLFSTQEMLSYRIVVGHDNHDIKKRSFIFRLLFSSLFLCKLRLITTSSVSTSVAM